MTYQDVLTQILCEVSGRPKKEIERLFDHMKENFPGKHKLDKELDDLEAQKLIGDLRKEKAGILSWLERGSMMAEKNQGHA